MNFQEQLEKFENNQGTTAVEELVMEQPTESVVGAEPVIPAVTEEKPTAEVITPEVKNTPEVPSFDPNKFLEESSEGLFKTVDEFKSNLTKVKEYDTLKQERDELALKAQENPFANDYVKKYNDLVKSGKSKDQIESFVRINQLGDLSELTPMQIKVEALVQEGYKRDVAERKITRDFGLNIETEGDHLTEDQIEENKALLEDKMEELRISSNHDLAKLEELKVKLGDTTDNEADNKALAHASQMKEYQEKLKPTIAQIASAYTGLGELNVNGKTGAEAKLMSFDADPEYKKEVETKLFDYFKDGSIPVNAETVADAKNYVDAEYFIRNKEKVLQTAYNQGVADTKVESVQEFENKSGIPISGLAPTTVSAEATLRQQQKAAARGEDD